MHTSAFMQIISWCVGHKNVKKEEFYKYFSDFLKIYCSSKMAEKCLDI